MKFIIFVKVTMLFDTKFKDTIVLIRISSKCIYNCPFCLNSVKKINYLYSLEKLQDIFLFIRDNVSNKISICISGYNLLNFDLVNKLVDTYFLVFKDNFTIPYFFLHVGFNDILSGLGVLKKINKNIGFSIQHIIRSKQDFLLFLKTVHLILSSDFPHKFEFYIIILDKKFLKLFEIWKKKLTINSYLFNMGNILIEYNFYPGLKNIFAFSLEECYGRKMVKCCKKSIFIESGIEIKLNGDIKLHSNQFCNKGIQKISNIYKPLSDIHNDFVKFEKIINSSFFNSSKDRCIKCISNPIKI